MEIEREEKARGLERRKTGNQGRNGEVVCSTRIKQTELVPCEKAADQEI